MILDCFIVEIYDLLNNFKIFNMSKQNNGFTLIELLVVIAVIGLLASIVLVAVNSARAKARDTKRISDFGQIALALELFYDQVGKYPQSPGHATWSGHWAYFSGCLEAGTNCGYTVSNYESVMTKVPQDPRRTAADPFANDATYFPAYPTECSDGQSYKLRAVLETIDADTVSNDLDGSYYNDNAGCDGSVNYCVGVGTCAGW